MLSTTGDLSPNESGIGVILLQQLLDIATALIVGATAARFIKNAFLPSAAICLLIPAQVIHSFMLLPESLMVFICAVTGYLWIRLYQSENERIRINADFYPTSIPVWSFYVT